jgi:competence protein ComEA
MVKSRTSRETPALAAFCTLSAGRISVKVSGAVRHPGIYEVPVNTMAMSVIKMADPLRPIPREIIASPVDLTVKNGDAVTFVTQADGSSRVDRGCMTVRERLVLRIPLDITTMNDADFEHLPGIGPVLVRRIIEYRQNNGGVLRVEDLANVDGIGEKKFALLRSYFQPMVNAK